MKLLRTKSWLAYHLCAGTAALLLFFLVQSSPHRVHHSFDQTKAAQCVVFSVAQGCHLKPTSAINLPIAQISIEGVTLSLEVLIPYRTPSPFSQRAPPKSLIHLSSLGQ